MPRECAQVPMRHAVAPFPSCVAAVGTGHETGMCDPCGPVEETAVVIGPCRQRVLMIVVAQQPEPALARIATNNGWPLRRAASAREGYRRITRERPSVALVQVGSNSADAFALIRSFRDGPHPIRTVAVAASHDDTVECSARIAGAGVYVVVEDCPEALEQTVAVLLEAGRDGRSRASGSPQSACFTRTSSLFSSFTEQRVAGCWAPPPGPGGGGDRAGDRTRRWVSRKAFGMMQGESA